MQADGGRGDGVDIPGARIDTGVAFIPKYRWFPFFVGFICGSRVPATFFARRRRGDDGGINDGASPHDPTLLVEDLVLRHEQRLAELVLFEEVLEVEQRGRSGTCSRVKSRPMNLRIAYES